MNLGPLVFHSVSPSYRTNSLECFQRRQEDEFLHVEDVKLESYVNTMCPGPRQSFFIGGKKGFLVKIDL